MPVKVLVVDDSGFFRRRIAEILNADIGIEVVGTAEDGQKAVDAVKELDPDVVTMDIEMPVMDGITAVRKIMADHPRPILMFSSLTTEGAQATLDALEAGAVDFLPKRFSDMAGDEDSARALLRRRVRSLARSRARSSSAPGGDRPKTEAPVSERRQAADRKASETARETPKPPVARPPAPLSSLRAVLIGTSTGGPVALQEVLKHLPANFPLPVVLVQHMPASFTPAFAERLDAICPIRIKQAVDGDFLRPGTALLAPGGQQLTLERGSQTRVRVTESPAGTIYKPSVDAAFESAVDALRGQVLAIILTGMGADGREGVRALKGCGAQVWSQDAATSVVYGMPAAVAEAGLTDHVYPLPEIGPALVKGFC
ncbi:MULTISPECIES: chemotaxis response regulator protein-glutamate methylesterase [unclassified Thioalkalivibrio]|uniref:protein-glutamate methylesterase/protein-glutamine glutaminase n=1 Tax=unclassified Thioalkalivibrio TaxID=2621013 RepID=UPI00036BE968|nr:MULTISPECIES: chemotaxis response regulator protein-glutamate methylesterase [unclassified Thioalkalivibrio]